MKFSTAMKKILTEACIYNTVAVLVLYSAGALVSGKSGLIPTLQSLYMILLFCVALSASNLLLASEKFGTALRVALHFIVVTVIFYTVFIAWGGFARNASASVIVMLIYTAVYAAAMIVYLAVSRKRRKKESPKESYMPQFNAEGKDE